MSKLRRYYSKGNVYFVTVVTYNRRPILLENIDIFWSSVEKVKSTCRFELIAWVILYDHFHMIIRPGDRDLSEILKRFKLSFSMNYRKWKGLKSQRLWQLRFWDHIIRNQEDLNRHLDYIHYNPVKHGVTSDPFEFEYSSLSEFSEFYPKDWGSKSRIEFDGNFGE